MDKKSPRIIPKLTKSNSKSSTLNKNLKNNKNSSNKYDTSSNNNYTNYKSTSDVPVSLKELEKQQEKQKKMQQQQLKLQQQHLKQEKKLLQKIIKSQKKQNNKENKYDTIKATKAKNDPESTIPNTTQPSSLGINNLNIASDLESKFLEGIQFKGKLIGIEPVMAARGDKMCQNALKNLRLLRRSTSSHKQRIIINIKLSGVQLLDQKKNDLLANHVINLISYITRDAQNNRSFGYVYGTPDVGYQFIAIKSEKDSMFVMNAIGELFTYVYNKKKKEKIQRDLEAKSLESEKISSSNLNTTLQKVQDDRNNQMLMNLIKHQQERQQINQLQQSLPQSSQFERMYNNVYNFPSNEFSERNNYNEHSFSMLPVNENSNYSSNNNLNSLSTYGTINSANLNSSMSAYLRKNTITNSNSSIASQVSQGTEMQSLKQVVTSVKKVNDKYKEWQKFDDKNLDDFENKTSLKEEIDSNIEDNDWASFSPPNHPPPSLNNSNTNDEMHILPKVEINNSIILNTFDQIKSDPVPPTIVKIDIPSINIKNKKNSRFENKFMNDDKNSIKNQDTYFQNQVNLIHDIKNQNNDFNNSNINSDDINKTIESNKCEINILLNKAQQYDYKWHDSESLKKDSDNEITKFEDKNSNTFLSLNKMITNNSDLKQTSEDNYFNASNFTSFDITNKEETINLEKNKLSNILSTDELNTNKLDDSNFKSDSINDYSFESDSSKSILTTIDTNLITNDKRTNLDDNLFKIHKNSDKLHESSIDLNNLKKPKTLNTLDDKYAVFNEINSIDSIIFDPILEKDTIQKSKSLLISLNKNKIEHKKEIENNQLDVPNINCSDSFFDNSYLNQNEINQVEKIINKNHDEFQESHEENTDNNKINFSLDSSNQNNESGFSSLPPQTNSFYCQLSASPDLIESHKRFLHERQEKLDQIDQIFEVEKEKIRNQQKQMNQTHFKQQKNLLNEQKNQQQEFYHRQKQQKQSILHQLQLQRLPVVQFDHYKLQLQQKLQNDQKCLMSEFVKRQQDLKKNQILEQNKLIENYKILEQQYLEKQSELLNSEFEFESELLDLPNIFEEETEFEFDNNFKNQFDFKLCNEVNKISDIQSTSNNSSPRLFDRCSTSCSITSINSQNPFVFEDLKQIEKFLSDSFDKSLSFLNNNNKEIQSLNSSKKNFDGNSLSVNNNSMSNLDNINENDTKKIFNFNSVSDQMFSSSHNNSNDSIKNASKSCLTNLLNTSDNKNQANLSFFNNQLNEDFFKENKKNISQTSLQINKKDGSHPVDSCSFLFGLKPLNANYQEQNYNLSKSLPKIFDNCNLEKNSKTDDFQNNLVQSNSFLLPTLSDESKQSIIFNHNKKTNNLPKQTANSKKEQTSQSLSQQKSNYFQISLNYENLLNKYSETLPKSMKNTFNKSDDKDDPFNCSYVDKKLDEINRIKELRHHTQQQLVSLTSSDSLNNSSFSFVSVLDQSKTFNETENQLNFSEKQVQNNEEKKINSNNMLNLKNKLIDTFDPLFNKIDDDKNFNLSLTSNLKALSNLDLFNNFCNLTSDTSSKVLNLPSSNDKNTSSSNNFTNNNFFDFNQQEFFPFNQNDFSTFNSKNSNSQKYDSNNQIFLSEQKNEKNFLNFYKKNHVSSPDSNIFTNKEDPFNDDFFK